MSATTPDRPAIARSLTAGHVVVRALEAHGVERVFGVPGESYLEVLDGLYDSGVEIIVCRHEGGAAYMAEAHGKITGRPGVALVTRGPGAANAMIGLHQAFQDATPLVLFVGLVPVADRDRESFQEFDVRGWFATTTKRVLVIDDADSAARVVAEAMHAAASGRPGPVVVGLPEDVITHRTDVVAHAPRPLARGAVGPDDTVAIRDALGVAERPVVVTGRNAWSASAAAAFTAWVEAAELPVLSDWRSPDVVPTDSSSFAGVLGYGRDDDIAGVLDRADALLAVGTPLLDVSSDGHTLRRRDDAPTIVVAPDPELRGHSGPLTRHVLAHVDTFADALPELPASPARSRWRAECRGIQESWAALPDPASDPSSEGPASMTAVMAALAAGLPREAIITGGAGNHNAWQQRYLPNRHYPSLVGSRNGSMGYSIPSAVAACLAHPERLVVTVVGDGEVLMNGAELATAVQYGASPLVVLMDNGQYGTIRGHQEQRHPGRVSGTQLRNPDFAALMAAMGGHGERVACDADIAGALDRCLGAVRQGRPALLHVLVDPLVLSP